MDDDRALDFEGNRDGDLLSSDGPHSEVSAHVLKLDDEDHGLSADGSAGVGQLEDGGGGVHGVLLHSNSLQRP